MYDESARRVSTGSISNPTPVSARPQKARAAVAVLAAGVCVFSGPVFAQEDPASKSDADLFADEAVEEMVVVGEARAEMDVLAGATTTRIETDLRLVEGAQIDDLLAEVPGVQIRRFGGVGERFEISIRGSTPEQVPVFLDGIRLDSSLTGRSDLSTLCLDVLDEIQVTRGAGAARAGTGAIGGVVNLVPRQPTDEPETRLRIAGGNFGTVEGSLRHARRLGAWDLSLAYCGFRTEGDYDFRTAVPIVQGVPQGRSSTETRENNEAERHTGFTQVGRDLGPGRFKLTNLTSHLDRGAPGLDVDPRNRAEERNFSTLTQTSFDLPLRRLTEGEFQASLAHRFERNQFEDPESSSGRGPIDLVTSVHSFTARSNVGFQFDALAGTHRFSILAEGRLDRRAANETKTKSRAGVALRAELASRWFDDRLRIAPSLRFERYGGLEEEWIPGLFVEALPVDWLTLKASAARSYRIPTFQELFLPDKGFERGNEDLRPEEAWNFEVGAILKSPFASPWLEGEIEATWFAGEVDESIVFQLISADVSAPVNTGETKTRGYELALRWRPHPWFRASAARTVTQARLESNRSNAAGIAVSQIDGRLELGPREKFKLVGEVHYTGRIPLDSGGLSELRSRVAYDASAAIDLSQFSVLRLGAYAESLWLSVRGRNLSDVALRDSRSFPRPGRNFSVALEGVF